MRDKGWPPPPRVDLFDEPPYAEIERESWCTWWIKIHHGVFTWGPDGGPFWHIGTEASARERAERLIAACARQNARHRAPRIRVEGDSDAYRREHRSAVATNAALSELRDPAKSWDADFERLSATVPRRRLVDRIRSAFSA